MGRVHNGCTGAESVSDRTRKEGIGKKRKVAQNTPDVPDLTRRRLVRGAAAAAPVVLTLRSGAAMAQVSACLTTAWQPGMEPSDSCVEPLDFGPKFEPGDIFSAYPPKTNGTVSCQAGVGYDTTGDGVYDLCCPKQNATQTVLITASSATSLTGCRTVF